MGTANAPSLRERLRALYDALCATATRQRAILPPSQPAQSPAEERFAEESAGAEHEKPPTISHTWRW